MPVINIKEQKKALRARFKKLREACPEDIRQKLDEKLCKSFLSLDEYKNCDALFTFVSGAIECDTKRIIAQAFADGKKVAVPRCINKSGEMEFYYISSFDDLVRGMYNISEPDVSRCQKAESFDYQHYRVGFGKGYYDRFLDEFSGISAGICYSKYIVSEVPKGAFDRNTDILVTEKFIDRIDR